MEEKKTKKRLSEKEIENKREYFRQADKNKIRVRMTPEEKAILQNQMKKDGWTNTSGYIRFRLFGWEPEKKVDAIIKSHDKEGIGILLANKIEELTNTYTYIMYRYERDMNQLWREEGVNLKDWTSVTNRWHSAFMTRLREAFGLFNKIAKSLGLEEAADMDMDTIEIDLDNTTKEEMDAVARQIRKRQIALGLPNTFE